MIREGMYVTHLHREEWGVGKVLEGHCGTTLRLWFELGGERKIGCHYHQMLQVVAKPTSFHVPSVKSSPPKGAAADKFQREYFAGRWEFTFSRAERDGFKGGNLVRPWSERYPHLFDAEDTKAASIPPEKGVGRFFEWVAAIRLFETRGYHSLVDYASPTDLRKRELVREICGEETADLIAAGTHRLPDLIVFTPDRSEWFFCEVKGPGDVVRKSEETSFPVVARKTGAGIFLVVLSLR